MKKNSLEEKLVSLFFKSQHNRQKNMETAQASMNDIINSFELLNEKANNLRDNFPEQKALINEYFEQVQKIEPSASVRAGKFEQALAQQITRVSSLCDKVFTSSDSSELDVELKNLDRAIRERMNADVEVEE